VAKQRSRRRRSGAGKSGGRGSSGGASRAKRSPTDHQEIEWQFDVAEVEPVEGWLGHHSSGTGLVVAPEATEEITDTYYDTEDWRFYRAGYALRVRKTGQEVEATMKSLAPAEDGLRRRREISEPLEDDRPATLAKAPGPIGEISRALVGEREVRELFRIRTTRQKFALLLKETTDAGANGSPGEANGRTDGGAEGDLRIGEVLIDTSEIPLDEDEEPTRLRRIEVEAGAGTAPTPDLRGFVDEMQFALELKPASISKYEAGLYAAGLSPSRTADLGPTEVDPSMSVGEVAFAVLRRQFAEMQAHEPGTRLGEDPERLHDMRVATRRMRAAMKVFEGALPERARWLREELRWLAGALGEVRDLDVQLARVQTWEEETDREGSESLKKILDLMRKRRAEARKKLLDVLDSGRYERLESSFSEMLRRGPGAERELARSDDGRDPAQEPITVAAPVLLHGRYRKWRKAARRLDETSSPEDFHDLRKKGKRLRYALEFVSEVYGEPVHSLVTPLKVLQDDLGDHQDAIVISDYLRELGTTTGGTRIPRGMAFTMGVYSERYAREASGLRSRVLRSEPFRALAKGKEWRGFEKAMKEARKGQGFRPGPRKAFR
jgi:CHAD domain-containing protein